MVPGFRLPLVVGQPARVDPHSLHALPAALPHEAASPHVLLVGFSVPWLHRATDAQWQQLQSHGFRLGLSRGGVSAVGVMKEKICAADEQAKEVLEAHPGLLEACLISEGHQHLQKHTEGCDLHQDVREDTAAEGSVTGRGAYARRLEERVFEPANWERVRQYLTDLGLEHLIGPIDELGVDDLEDFEFLYREDLMEAGATKEEAEAILSCTGASREGRADPPPLARAGLHRPSRPAAQGFQGPAVAARIVNTEDRANRVAGALQDHRNRQAPSGAATQAYLQLLQVPPQVCQAQAYLQLC